MMLRRKENDLLNFCRMCHGRIDINGKGEDINLYDCGTSSHGFEIKKCRILDICSECGRIKRKYYTHHYKKKHKDRTGIEDHHPAFRNHQEANRGWDHRSRRTSNTGPR